MSLRNIVAILLILTIAFLIMAAPCMAKTPIRTIEGTVVKVSDADTVQIIDGNGTKVKVRLYGIDAPETRKPGKVGQLYGDEAHQILLSKVNRRQVRLDVMDVDQYKRIVGIVWLGDRNINLEMVAEGWAWAYRQYLSRPYASEFVGAEEQARKQGRGIWQQPNVTPPWEFRKKRSWLQIPEEDSDATRLAYVL